MAIGLIMEFDAPEGDVMALYDQANIDMRTHEDHPEGLIFHWGAKSPKGLRVVDVWESKAHFDRFFRERLGPTSVKLNLPRPTVEEYEIHAILKAPSLANT